MRKRAAFYVIGFILLVINLVFFNKAYRALTTFSQLTNKHNIVQGIYQGLSRKINNAAILNPDLIKASRALSVGNLFFTDSLAIIGQLNLLKAAVQDSINIQTNEKLDNLIKSELSWLLNSNVPDSIIHDKAPGHIASFKSIDSLITKGIRRTGFLIEYRKIQLNGEIENVKVLIIVFVVLSGILLLYTTISLFKEKSRTEKTERELEIVFNRISDGVVSVDNNWRYTLLNNAAMATHPLGRRETIGKVIWEVHPEMKGTIFWDKYHEAMQTKKMVEVESYYLPMDIWFAVSVYPSADGLTIFYKNITQNKKLQEQQNLFASIVNSSDDAILSKTLDGIITSWNHGAEKIFKYSSEEIIGEHISILVPAGLRNEENEIMEKIRTGETIEHFETERMGKDGKIINVSLTISPIKDPNGSIIGASKISRDITMQKKAEEKIAASEIHFRSLIENSAEGIALTDALSNNIYRSPAALKLMGNVPKENTVALAHPDDLEAIKHIRVKAMENPGLPVPFQGRFLHSSGHYVWLEGVLTNLLHVKGVNAVVTNFRDISARKEIEEKLIANEKRFRALIENSNDIISLLDGSFKVVYRSPAAFRITGWNDEEMTDSDGTRNIHPDDIEKARNIVLELMANPGKPVNCLFRNLHKEGHYLWIEGVAINLLQDEHVKAIVFNFRDVTERIEAEEKLTKSEKIYKIIASSIPGSVIILLDTDLRYLLVEGDMLDKMGYSKEKLLGNRVEDVVPPQIFEEVRKDFEKVLQGETVIRESSRGSLDLISRYVPLKDQNNTVYAILVAAIDITELKDAQRSVTELNRDLEEKINHRTLELRKANEELEAFSYSVSHDLRAPLRAIIAFAQILEEEYSSKLDDEAKRITSVIRDNTLKMGNLIDDLLAFSRMGKQGIIKIEINTNLMVREIVREQEQLDERHHPINWDIHDLPSVNADMNMLRQVWVNLVSNAIKYSGNREEPRIEIGSYPESGQAVFYIRDNGAGFDEEYKDKLFKVFQRLHDADEFEGTGIGLALVERIISRHDGKLWAEGKEGEGACFYFSLP